MEKEIRKSDLSITKIAKRLEYTGRHMYNLFEKEDLPAELFVKVGKIIGHDFGKDIPAVSEYLILMEPTEAYNINQAYQQKYLDLMEAHLSLIAKYDALKSRVEPVEYKKAPRKKAS